MGHPGTAFDARYSCRRTSANAFENSSQALLLVEPPLAQRVFVGRKRPGKKSLRAGLATGPPKGGKPSTGSPGRTQFSQATSRQEGIALQRESAHQASGLHLRSSSRCSASEQSNRDLRRQTHPASCPNRKGGSAARRFGSRPQPRPDHGARSICRALTSCETACPVPAASTPPTPTRSRRWRRK
jgi:hypothetical protein